VLRRVIKEHSDYIMQFKNEKFINKNLHICQICNQIFFGNAFINQHLFKIHHLTSQQYYDQFLKKENDDICLRCGEKTRFVSLGYGYTQYCSDKCYFNSDELSDRKSEQNVEIGKNSLIKRCFDSKITLLEDYINSDLKYHYKCNVCGHLFKDNVYPVCLICNPKLEGRSEGEIEFANYVKSIYTGEIEENKRFYYQQNHCYETDVYITEKKIGLEYNGVFWHSHFSGGKSQAYHKHKLEKLNECGVDVIQFWDYEWEHKQEIVKSMILSKLGLIKESVFARKCKIEQIKNNDANSFYDQNHLQGKCNHVVSFGLFYDNALISCLSFNESNNKKYEWEISRYANKINTSVVGSFGKLFSHFVKMNHPKSIMTFANLRYSNGRVYKANGFVEIIRTDPNYFYTLKGMPVGSRMKFQKHRLEKLLEEYDPSLSEWENMKANGYDRVYDCGNLLLEWKNEEKR
jgi:rubrerythrin